ncbi:ABC transporter permease [Actinomyces polynesiensis]|uniref:ABC transporter permease n=1 Tax=Actinomyces polynesiensis TaxID=1325934 RepID=UPI0005BC1C66|nr:ABC transporter permease subunit [Actinomyces polynesiensis]
MSWLLDNSRMVVSLLGSHVVQAGVAVLAAFVIAVPLAHLAARRGWLRGVVETGSGLMYAIPSLPLLVVLPLVLGTGLRSVVNVVVALTIYGLALMVPQACAAFRSVDREVLDSATAVGYGPRALFARVELPLAGPALLGGLRIVSMSTIALVTIGGVLGVPSLGMLFVDGFQRGILAEILSGLVLTVLLALAADAALVGLGRLLMPWTRAQRRTGQRSRPTASRESPEEPSVNREVRV